MRAGWLVLSLTACGQVLQATPNAYPCDFSQPPGVRDQACVPGDVCGVTNRCQRYLYEGPRFEGAAALPTFASGQVLHPLVLDEAPLLVARGRNDVVVSTSGDAVAVSNRQLVPWPPFSMNRLTLGEVTEAAVFNGDSRLAVRDGVGAVQVLRAPMLVDPLTDVSIRHLRSLSNDLWATTLDGRLGRITDGLRATFTDAAPDAGPFVDVTRVARKPLSRMVAVRNNALLGFDPDGGVSVLAGLTGVTVDSTLTVDVANTVLAVNLDGKVLSTWQVSDVLELTSAWPDCTPCARGSLEAVTPLPPAMGLAVEVLCRAPQGRSVVRITGSTATDPTQTCQSDPTEPKVPALTRAGPLTFGQVTGGVLAGGPAGELWSGPFLSAALPSFLDRVPVDVGMATTLLGKQAMVAVTDDYFAIQETLTPIPNGFRRVDLVSDFRGGPAVTLLCTIRGVEGWGVLSNGVVAKVSLSVDGGTLGFGPRLLTTAEQPITRSGGGEAFIGPDGGTLALYIAADDGVYALTGPAATLSDVASGNDSLSPQLNPEPSTPIRSFALERTPLGTDGVSRARGYLVTARNVYAWQLAGTPPRWSATPLVLTAGEPVEVWFDRPRGAVARVGYRDGTVFTLPGGYQLTEAIPGDGGVAVQVFDYENLGGWPVASASTGLFAAQWDVRPDGTLQNTFADGGLNRPMTWREVSLPDGGRPWLERRVQAKLFVKADPPLTGSQTFHLIVFVDNQVLEVGSIVRTP